MAVVHCLPAMREPSPRPMATGTLEYPIYKPFWLAGAITPRYSLILGDASISPIEKNKMPAMHIQPDIWKPAISSPTEGTMIPEVIEVTRLMHDPRAPQKAVVLLVKTSAIVPVGD